MNKQYKKERFESRDSCLIWCADNKPIFNHKNLFDENTDVWSVSIINGYWQNWRKAIEIVPEKRVIEVWVNVYGGDNGSGHKTLQKALMCKASGCIGTIKLSKEITIVDGKVVENE